MCIFTQTPSNKSKPGPPTFQGLDLLHFLIGETAYRKIILFVEDIIVDTICFGAWLSFVQTTVPEIFVALPWGTA